MPSNKVPLLDSYSIIYCIFSWTGKKTSQEKKDDESAVTTDREECMEEVRDKPADDEQQTGFIGDILNLEAPEGSLDVGFI